MNTTLHDLREILNIYPAKFNAIPEEDFAVKSTPAKWSKKEVVGHLIDSAQNNLRRFIVGQYERAPHIVYQQDFWVAANGYNRHSKSDIIQLWRLVNGQIVHVLENMPVENYAKECSTGEIHSLEWLASDYVKHLKHHINQIIPGSFNVQYP